jgi:CubicO group peptidase (beta-lactamase class C family)
VSSSRPERTAHAIRTGLSGLTLLTLLACGTSHLASADAPVTWPGAAWPTASPAALGMDPGLLAEAVNYAQTYGGAGLIVRQGRVVASWGSTGQRFDLKSTTKSIGTTALGLAMADGLAVPDDLAIAHMPAFGTPPAGNAATGWLGNMTLLQLATHTAGFAKPGGYGDVLHAPGSTWMYSDGGLNWLADVLTTRYHEDLNSLLFRRVFAPLGITPDDLVWRPHAYRETTLDGVTRREFGAGIKANVDAMARIGYLYLTGGVWNDARILPAEFVDLVRRPSTAVVGLSVTGGSNPADTSNRYGVAWFTNSDGSLPEVPQDTYWAWGLLDSLIVVMPSLDIVAVRTGQGLGRTGWNADYSFIAPFITPIARSAAIGVPTSVVPNLSGRHENEAVTDLLAAGLVTGAVSRVAHADIPADHVIAQDPAAGMEVPGGTEVALVVSLGAAPVLVPDVVGQLLEDAAATLQASGLSVGSVTETSSASVPLDTIAAQAPAAGTAVASGAAIELHVSTGPADSSEWLNFDGVNDVVSVPSSAPLRLSSRFSIESRIRPQTISTDRRQDRILRKGADYELMISTHAAGCASGTRGDLQLSATIGGTVRKLCAGALTPSAWQHVAGTYDGTELVLYIDGVRVGSMPASGAVKRSSTVVTIGNVKALSRAFHGALADVAIWSRALTPAEVQARAYGAPSGSEAGLVAWWPARDGGGQTLRDEAPGGLHGRLGLTQASETSDPAWEP